MAESAWIAVWRLDGLADEELAVLAREGCTAAAELLMRRYRSLVENKARYYFFAGADREDVIQEGMIGLVKAIRDFSGDRKTPFRSFAELCVTRQIITALKTARRNKHALLNDSVSLDSALQEEDEEGGKAREVLLAEETSTPEAMALAWAAMAALRRCVRAELSPLERGAFLGYVAGLPYRHIARQLNCRVKQVDNALQRAKKKIARHLLAVL